MTRDPHGVISYTISLDFLCASVAGVDGIAQWTDLEDGLDFRAGFGVIVPEVNFGHRLIPNNCKNLHETLKFVILTFSVWTRYFGNILPHSLDATQLRERVAALPQKGTVLVTQIFLL